MLLGKPFRKSLKTRNKQAADKQLRKLESGEVAKEEKKQTTVAHALAQFIIECEQWSIANGTLKKLRFLSKCIGKFA
ncbi:MAG: hypothetical protein KGN84_10260, partial [Acidobacteriota bacterium]|nr:hypothetical protein [Acidobacteriota bacterium]